ncbi:MAG TPA: filamentous hemagglutinin N-terminal domain-containing protein, partial [Gammaproteobacteria bacterium]|nr:filamentous hemagglutinin N-terminal domain-containing protein [Gammaproteobacteria bacterium]
MATKKVNQARNNKPARVRTVASRNETRAREAVNIYPRAVALAVTTAFMPWFVPFTAHAQAQPPAPNTTPTLQLTSPAGSGYVHPAQGAYLQVDQYANRASYAGTIQLGSAAHMNVVQPNSGAVALFKDTSGQTSQIWGRVTANGHLFFTNSAGVLFGRTASVEVGSLLATTLPINEQDFLDNKNQIRLGSASGSGKVENYGRIVTVNGYTALVAPQVINDGLILAHAGTVALTAADRVSLDLIGDGLISINVDQAAMNASIVNSGTIEANGGQVLLTARSANALLDTVINSTGVIRANSLVERNGEIVLDGGGAGVVLASGTLEAAGKDAGTTGGTVKVLGQYVGLVGEAKVDVSGDAGGGT